MRYLYFIICFLNIFYLQANTLPIPSQTNSPLSFTENKGQLADQYNKPRRDILFSGTDGALNFYINNSGISYQLRKANKFVEVVDARTKQKRKEITEQTFYRIDMNWLNANTDLTIKTDDALPGYDNYYLPQCPDGVLNVKSYSGLVINNIYNNINLHYYQSNGHLKYDYIVAPHANYKQIKLEVKGVVIKRKADGGIILKTSIGDVEEGKPVVYQNGKQLKAKWQIQNNVLSFDIENYDPAYELIIDPLTRSWGTYYGGVEFNNGAGTTTDPSGNVYLTGNTENSVANLIATVGAHQTTYNGSVAPGDAFLAKFNTAGVRLWATYYGGSSADAAYCCATDASGNVFMGGVTASSSGISTAGAQQTLLGGNADAFLVKFNSAGVRQWATYCGAAFGDYFLSCSTDASGNIYAAGYSTVLSSTLIATVGSHQPNFSSGDDAILVKYNSAGVRQWGTYYGDTGNERGNCCVTDPAGNVYVSGSTDAPTATVIATTSGHQPLNGGFTDAFLVKFDANGVRQWGTYYGGNQSEEGNACATDASGNVYLAGSAPAYALNEISTPASHQPINGGLGPSDAFLVKFNSAGVRQWGTYYGGPDSDKSYGCATDVFGNVYICGNTDGVSSTGIISPGCYQSALARHFLAKFNSAGTRQWGTFYGATIFTPVGNSCTTDLNGNIYMAGCTSATTNSLIASAGGHQPAYGGGYDAYLVKFRDCLMNPIVNTNNPICTAANINFSTTVSSGTTTVNYSWAGPNSFTSAVQNPVISGAQLANAGTYTLTADDLFGCIQTVLVTVSVNVTPTVTVNSGTICSGNNFIMTPSGAITYSYSGGSATVTPLTNTNYNVTGFSANGCTNVATSSVIVNTTPTISVNSGSVCSGTSFTIVPSGANTYTIQGGNAIVSPLSNTSYTVIGTSTQNCISANTVTSNINVVASPTVNATSSATNLICAGNNASLTANGATSYTWNTTATTSIIVVSPTVTTTYSVTGANAAGCVNTAILTQSVSACTGLTDSYNNLLMSIFPNPGNGIFYISMSENNNGKELELYTTEGKLLKQFKTTELLIELNLNDYSNGLYILKVKENNLILNVSKIIKN